jgi:hypothetical protein
MNEIDSDSNILFLIFEYEFNNSFEFDEFRYLYF